MNTTHTQHQFDLFYPVKVWFISIIGGPSAFYLLALISQEYGLNDKEGYSLIGLIFFFGFLYSLPLVVISFLVCRYLLIRELSSSKIKILLIVIGFVMFVIFLAIIGFQFSEPEAWTLPICYSVCFLAGSLFYKIRRNYNP